LRALSRKSTQSREHSVMRALSHESGQSQGHSVMSAWRLVSRVNSVARALSPLSLEGTQSRERLVAKALSHKACMSTVLLPFDIFCFKVGIYLDTFIVEEKVENYVYEMDSAVAAIGGSLGLFLGYSCYSVVTNLIEGMRKSKDKTVVYARKMSISQ
jgi:hypothetical protein